LKKKNTCFPQSYGFTRNSEIKRNYWKKM